MQEVARREAQEVLAAVLDLGQDVRRLDELADFVQVVDGVRFCSSWRRQRLPWDWQPTVVAE